MVTEDSQLFTDSVNVLLVILSIRLLVFHCEMYDKINEIEL